MSFANCGVTESFERLQKETDRAAQLLEKDLGSRPQINFNVTNQRLTVNVVFQSDTVEDLKASELHLRVQQALGAALADTPEQTIVSIRYSK